MRRALAGWLAGVVIAASALVGGGIAEAATVPGTTPPIPTVGVHFHGTWSDYTDAQRLAVLDQLAAAGVEWVRIPLSWTNFETSGRGVITRWYRDQIDFLVNAAQARGLKVLGSIWGVPSWANGGASWNVPPTDPAEFGRFMGWAASYYKGRMGAWEIWNEPDLDYFFKNGDIVKYAALARAAYPAIKAADPAVPVAVGAFNSPHPRLVSTLYDNGIKGNFDVIALHAYPHPADTAPENMLADGAALDLVSDVHDLMVAKGDGNKNIWLTEIGWS
ncbi:MAG TPA: cellulase family glycosylhydrolase, partial [Acidimicrobiales bacterium]